MIPLELKIDKYGLLYTDDIELIKDGYLNIDNRDFRYNRYYQNDFHSLKSTDEYIIKFSTTCFTKKEIKKILEMLDILISKQKYVPNVDFPIGYYVFMKKLQGLIVKYYKNGISLDNVVSNGDICGLGKYYSHDEDNIRNLFMLFDSVLDLEYEMFENGIYYKDINPGNIILTDNVVKIIDFDYRYISFDDKNKGLKGIMESYICLLDIILKQYKLMISVDYEGLRDFDQAKKYTKKLENYVRKG